MEYFIILMIMLGGSFFLEKIYHIHLYHNRRERLEIVTIFFVIGVIWDTFAIWRGHWMFPSGRNLGITIGLMPFEEYLFALIVPYFILTIYKVIDSKFRIRKNPA